MIRKPWCRTSRDDSLWQSSTGTFPESCLMKPHGFPTSKSNRASCFASPPAVASGTWRNQKWLQCLCNTASEPSSSLCQCQLRLRGSIKRSIKANCLSEMNLILLVAYNASLRQISAASHRPTMWSQSHLLYTYNKPLSLYSLSSRKENEIILLLAAAVP